jgi:integrase
LGKGRKERCTPLRKDTVVVLKEWIRERRGQPSDPAFTATRGNALGYDGLDYLLNKHLAVARNQCPSLIKKRVTFHSLRHSRAMSLLHGGADRSVIALFLGHERVETTSVYLHADMRLKEKALDKASATNSKVRRYRPSDRLLTFLSSL